MDKVNLFVCDNYSPELISVCEKYELVDVSVTTFPCMCMNKGKKEETARMLSDINTKGYEGVVLCSKHCDILSMIPQDTDVEIHTTNYCFSYLASEPFINYALTKGGYIISVGWLNNWRTRIAEAGFNRDTAIRFYHDCCKELVFFDTGADQDAEKKLNELSQFLELPYAVIPVELEGMQLMIENVVTQRKLHTKDIDNSQAIGEIQTQCAEYAAIFDLMGRIATYANKRDTIDKVKEIFMIIFGAQQFKYWNNEYDKDSVPTDIKALLLNDEQDYIFYKEKNSFCIKIKWHNDVFGVIDVGEFLFPKYIEKYLNFAIEIVKISGLVFSNSEQYEKILRTEQELRYSATHDALTGLYNRTFINEILDRQTPPPPFTAFMFDMDQLKYVNDHYGHAEGDKLIISVAEILKKCFREIEVVARIGGDEFVAILHGINMEGAEIIKSRLIQKIKNHNDSMRESHLKISFSMGYAVGETPEDTLEIIMQKADELMYLDKSSKRPPQIR